MQNIRHIFFDLDNTLWDHRKNALLSIGEIFSNQNISEHYGINFDDFYEKYSEINADLWDRIRDGLIDKEYLRNHRFYDTFSSFGLENKELSDHFEHNFLDEILKYNELVPNCLDVLDYLKEKEYTLHIISNGFDEITHRKIQLSGLSNYFTTITSADDIGVRKPNPLIFEHSLKKDNAKKEESILIGDDWIADVKGAQNFGMDVLFFDVLDEDKQEDGLKVIKNLLEIKNYL